MFHLRTLVSLEFPIQQMIRKMAKRDGISISSKCRDLIRQALEIEEDAYWNKLATHRDRGFNWKKALTHKQVWGR